MINTNRIVPIQVIDLISMYGLILKQNSSTLAAVEATNPGEFEITAAATPLIANEPVASLDFASGVTSATVYFVPAYDYSGFTLAGVATTPTGDDVDPDGRTLYKAELASGAVTITQVGF